MTKAQRDFKADCGCQIHFIKWSSKQDVASVKSCPLHKAAPKLLEAARKIFAFIETGTLVRSTKFDAQPDWAVKQIPLVQALDEMQKAIKEAEQPND